MDIIKLAEECWKDSIVDIYDFYPSNLELFAQKIREAEHERCVAEAKRVKDIIAVKYQERLDSGTSDMTSNSDWMRLEGAVSVVEAIRSLK